jgi:uncharacterized membrane protein YgcG
LRSADCAILQHRTPRCSTVHHVATQYTTLQHITPRYITPRCNIVHHDAAQYITLQHSTTRCNTVTPCCTTVSTPPPQDRLALGRLSTNSGDRCSLRVCAEQQHAVLHVVFMRRGASRGQGGHWRHGGGGGRVFCARGARTRWLCGAKAACG